MGYKLNFLQITNFKYFTFTLLATVGILSCSKNKFEPSKEWIFYHDFEVSNHKWQTVYTLLEQPLSDVEKINCWRSWENLFACTSFIPTHIGEAVLASPWWLDANHAPPGAGYLNLLMYNYIDTIFKSKITNLNLGGKTFYLKAKSNNLDLKQSKLLFWFQTKSSNGKYINFAFTGMPIVLNEDIQTIKLKLSINPDLWTCLGSSGSRVETYDCASLTEHISNVNTNFGLILFPTLGDPNPIMQPSGRIFIKAIGLY